MFLGSALFMFSDFCIGINQFHTPLHYAQVGLLSDQQELFFAQQSRILLAADVGAELQILFSKRENS
jgi:hypothetical protein